MRYQDPATGRWLGIDGTTEAPAVAEPDTPRMRDLGATIVSKDHGSYLTCGRRLGCTNPVHIALRQTYEREKATDRRRRNGERPAAEAHPPGPHGTVSRYRKCTDGPDGRACQVCKDGEADRQRRYRASRRPA